MAATHSNQIMASPGAADLVGTVLADRYRILKKLGEGGMGSVYLAEHTTINKRLAIKVLSPEYSHKQDLVDRFLQEARAASMIEQENVVEITDFGSTPGGSVFFAMEFLNGEDLAGTIKREGPLPWSRVRVMMLQVCTALSAAHAAGIIHRDMKPENCYRIKRGSNEDFIKVLDFGIAKVQSDEGDGGKGLTRTGMIFGTPEYMSPEQAKGEKVDHRVDIYAAGVILYELLTGRVPFTADTFMGILTKHMFEAPPAPSMVAPDCAMPADVEAIILKALQKDREYRFQSMAEMARAIEAVGTGAIPVMVVREDVSAPRSGQIRFANNSTAIHLDGDPLDAPPQRSRAGLFVGLGVGAAVLALGGFFAMGGFGGDATPKTPTEPAPVVVAKADVPADPDASKATVTPPVVAPDAASVEVTIACGGVKAEVRSDTDDGLLGYADAPIKLSRGTTGLPVRLRAEGYQDLLVEITPDANKTISATLSPLEAVAIEPDAKKPHGTKKPVKPTKPDKGPTKPDKPGPVSTPVKPPVETPTKPDKPVKPVDPKKPPNGSPDLKDPFGGH
jgi:serine/threonine-protein kinase